MFTTFLFFKSYEIKSIFKQIYNIGSLCYNIYYFDINNIVNIKEKLVNSGFYGIKLIQWIVNRAELYLEKTPDVLLNLKNVYDNCEQHNIEYTKNICKKDCNYEFDSLIKLDSDIPFSSASIGQVYKGIYLPLNKEVAIKVKHPDLELNNIVIKYLLIIIHYIDSINNIFGFPININDYIESLDKQTNLNHEAINLMRMKNNFENNNFIIIPEVFIYSQNIIVMSYEAGEYIDDIQTSEYNKQKIGITMCMFVRQSYIINDFSHGDLHNYNWKVKQIDKNKYGIIIYDMGLCLETNNKKNLIPLIEAWEVVDVDKILNVFNNFLIFNKNNIHLKEHIKKQISDNIKQITIRPVNFNTILRKLLDSTKKYNIKIDSVYLNVIISLMLIESFFKKYNIIGDENENVHDSIDSVLKVDYLNMISFGKANNCFEELVKYFEERLKRDNVKFNTMFYNNSYKLTVGFKNEIIFSDSDSDE